MSNVIDRPLRADARRNRERVLAAARAVFAEQGRDAQMDDVARRADVGVGTVYRHFPTKDALLNALSDELFAVVAAYVRTLVDMEDAWEAFRQAMWFGAEKTAGDRAFTEIMAASRDFPPRTCPGKEDLIVTTGELMVRAKAQGRMRPDVVIDDIPLVMCGVGSASGMPHPAPDAWRRHLAIVLDGMRAEAASGPLPR
ncbi:MAG TPA: helix-turn-helix domain-containing protein [Solirubrobacteraceae bacterium]|nr:helix-turn-helix domain-containing protein [Solirubrobacteraceae bacterium]